MNWLYHRNYVGPNRRRDRFEVRFIERRKRDGQEPTRPTLKAALGEIFARGLKWVDALNYFGPDRRSGAFSHFILERRRRNEAASPPPPQSALRQLRVRVLGTETEAERHRIQERLTATAVLADLQGRSDVSDALNELVSQLEVGPRAGWSSALQAGLLAAEAMLDAPPAGQASDA